MPEFIPSFLPDNLPLDAAGYLECAEFTSAEDYGDDCKGWHDSAIAEARLACQVFGATADPDDIDAYLASGLDYRDLGRDIWFSRNGHGAGFFDRDADGLQAVAEQMGEVYVCQGDDGFLYIV